MVSLGVNIAILLDDQLLLTKREDFEIWCLPGGEVDPHESLAQAAAREALEETGLTVRLTRMVGLYSQPHWGRDGHHSILFAAVPIAGELRLCPGETIEVGYFAFDHIPPDLTPWHRPTWADVLSGVGGSTVQRQEIRWPYAPTLTRRELYAERDRSGLARSEFFWQHMGGQEVAVPSVIEVEGKTA